MTSPDSITQIAALGVEPTYSAQESALLLGRSCSWLDQRLRKGRTGYFNSYVSVAY